MKRPFSDSRPIGPFAQRGDPDEVLLTVDFSIHRVQMRDGSLEPEPNIRKQETNLHELVEDVGEDIFHGKVADVRVEDHAVNGNEGIRVVYNTQVNAVFKENVDEFEDKLETKSDMEKVLNEYGKMTIVST